MRVQDIHVRSLAESTALSSYYMPQAPTPAEVIAVLNRAGIRFMLVGAHALGGWIKAPRATKDVDVLVGIRHVKKAVRTLLEAFPHLIADDQEIVVRLTDPTSGDVVIDVIKPYEPLHQVALKHTREVKSHGQRYKIPTLEMALAMKFAPMNSPNRSDPKKHLDAHDFMQMILSNPEIDQEKLAELGELVHTGGGAELVEMVRKVRAGEKLVL